MHPGTSGSPVVMDVGAMQTTHGEVPSHRNKSLYLIGIHSATFYGTSLDEQRLEERIEAGREIEEEADIQLDLNVAWYP